MPLPIDTKLIYQLSCSVIGNTEFNLVYKNTDSPCAFQERRWFGNVWADLTNYKPYSVLQESQETTPSLFDHSIERALQVIFTRFATREFTQGLFLLRAEMGQDWYTPILQQPHCTLRHMNPFLVKPDFISPGSSSPLLQLDNDDLVVDHLTLPRKRSNTICTSHPSLFETYSIFYLGHNVKEFCSAFYPIGLIPGINSWSAVMTADPISEESSFELEDHPHPYSIPQGKTITLQDLEKSPILMDLGTDSHFLDLNDFKYL